MSPDEQGIFYTLIVQGGPGSGEFVYDASGNLRSSNVGQATTDPIQGLSCPQGFATWNGFGAIVNLLSTAPSKGAFFQYFDNLSAVQGALILAVASVGGTDPVVGTTYRAGMTGISPAFGDTTVVVGSTIDLATPVFSQQARIALIAGSGATRPSFVVFSPQQGGAGLALMASGISPDASDPAQVLVGAVAGGGFVAPVPATKALLEVQGNAVANGGIWALAGTASGNPPAGAEPWNDLGSTGLAGDAGTASYRMTPEGEVQLSIHKSFNALGAGTTATFANVLPAAYRPPATRLTSGDPIAINGAAPGASTRLTITLATGAVNLASLPVGATGAGCDVRIPLI